MNRVVITGSGIITGAGRGVKAHHESLLGGGPAFKTLEEVIDFLPFTLDGLHSSIGKAKVCSVPQTNEYMAEWLEIKKPDRFDRHQLFAIEAAEQAMESLLGVDVSNFACVGAIGGGGLLSTHEASKKVLQGKKLGPFDNLKFLSNIFVGHLTQRLCLRGPSHVHVTACAASMHAINDLVRMIKLGDVEGGLVVGTEAAISEVGIASFLGQKALGDGLPYRPDRNGFVMGEGSAALVLESEKHALDREAEILGEILGYGESSDAVFGGQITDPSPEGSSRAMRQALNSSGLALEEIDFVKAHGTATGAGDLSELKALNLIALPEVVECTNVMSMKSYFGHLLGAAGIAEIVAVLSCIKNGLVLPTRGLKRGDLDPECDFVSHPFDRYPDKIEAVLCNGFGFGGTNTSLVVGPYK